MRVAWNVKGLYVNNLTEFFSLPLKPRAIMEAHAPAINPPALLPAIVGEMYKPPDHSVTA